MITEDCRAVTDESGLLVITHEMMRQWDSIHGHLSPCGIFAVARIEAGEDVAAVAREGLERGFDDFDTLLKTPSNELGRFYDTDESFKLGFISLLARKNFEGGGALTEEDLRQTMFRLRNQFSFKRDWTSFVRRCAAGDYSSGSSVLMAMFPDHQVPEMGGQTTWPLIILHEDGTRSFGLMYHSTIFAPSSPLIRFWAVRNFMIIKNAPISNVLVDPATGTLLWQNPASCSEIGVHSLENSQPARGSQSRKPSLNFLALLFEGQDEVREEMLEEVKNGASFAKAVEIHSLELKRMLGCHNPEDPLFLKVYASQFYDPYSQKQCLNIVYVDKTAVILAQREVQQANADLAEEKQRLHVLLTRQYQLIEVMQSSFRNDPETDSPKNVLFKQKIQVLRDILSSAKGADEGVEEISLGRILGQGNVSAP